MSTREFSAIAPTPVSAVKSLDVLEPAVILAVPETSAARPSRTFAAFYDITENATIALINGAAASTY